MSRGPLIIYAGQDKRLFLQLEQNLSYDGHTLDWIRDPASLLSDAPPCGDWLLILDADLTRATSFELFRSIRSQHPDVPVIMVTDGPALANLGLARTDGAESLFYKPVLDYRRLRNTVRLAVFRMKSWARLRAEFARRRVEHAPPDRTLAHRS